MTRDDWFISATGRRYYVLSPVQEQISLEDIGHALSRICRFGGHLREDVDHYSVAQHSVHVSKLVPADLAASGLLHDATEAFLGDVIRPLKQQLNSYRIIEHNWEREIEARFGVSLGWDEVKHADRTALMTERRDLVAPHDWLWIEDERGVIADPEPIVPLDRRAAYRLFMARAEELGIK